MLVIADDHADPVIVAADLLAASRRPVIFTDVDTVWLRSPLEVLRDSPPGKSFFVAPDANESEQSTSTRHQVPMDFLNLDSLKDCTQLTSVSFAGCEQIEGNINRNSSRQ